MSFHRVARKPNQKKGRGSAVKLGQWQARELLCRRIILSVV